MLKPNGKWEKFAIQLLPVRLALRFAHTPWRNCCGFCTGWGAVGDATGAADGAARGSAAGAACVAACVAVGVAAGAPRGVAEAAVEAAACSAVVLETFESLAWDRGDDRLPGDFFC